MAKPSRLSLTDYANTETNNRLQCWMCHIPERAEVEQAVLTGVVTKAAAVRWLHTVCGYEKATPNRVAAHFNNHVERTP